MRLASFILATALASPWAAVPLLAQEDSVPALLGSHMAVSDSLGFEEYRALGAKEQLRLREEARRWLREIEDGPPHLSSFDACATAIGLCPYLAKAWLQYAQMHHEIGRYALSDYCLRQVRRTLRFEAREDERLDVERELYILQAKTAYNLGDLEGCLAHIEEALRLDDDQPELWLLQARSLGQLERYPEARSILRRFQHGHPLYARALSGLGNVEIRAARYDAARDAFARAAKYGQRGPVFLNDRGRLALATDRLDEAEDYFKAAVNLLPTFMEARSNLAVTLRRRGDLEASATSFRDILQNQADYAPAHFNLAEVLRQQWMEADAAEKPELGRQALFHYGQAIRYGYEPTQAAQRRAEFALQLDDLVAAEQDLLEITRDPDLDPSALYLLARVKKEQGDLRIASQLLDMAFAAGFDSGEAHGDAGEIHLRSGRIDQAIESFEKALARRPELIITRVNLSIALAMNGDLPAADAALREAEAREPDHPAVRAQRQALQETGGGRP